MNILLAEDEKQLSRALVTAMQATGYHVDPPTTVKKPST